ncbi:IscS subfamily cysteine desulfurase [Caldalkalibacillus salinus]|uniref:IscS subfamily cysteine desulfurase n=1 Tax=Caldalkalibacillus salinus TaxID=2803787 RepID=UPI001920AB39|nr:IscS subfamily cysteine desulfurase [Caldalkalibacillus salinus]
MIYLDYSATTPMSEDALATYEQVAKKAFGNVNSLHDTGTYAHDVATYSRRVLAKLIGGATEGLYFTGSGSEANALAIRSMVKAHQHKGKHVLTTMLEHASVLNTFSSLEQEGFEVDYIPVDDQGRIDVGTLPTLIRPDTILVSIHHASSDIGTIQPVTDIAHILRQHGVLFHMDAVQSFGKIEVNVQQLGVHSISLSAHKMYGPKGVGAVYIDPQVQWKSVMPHTTQENGFRPGTLDVPGIAAFATAAEETLNHMREEQQRCRRLTTTFLNGLQALTDCRLVGPTEERLPHHLGLRIRGMEGQYVMLECNRRQIAISTGTACLARHTGASLALSALGLTREEADEFFRVTIGKHTSEVDIRQALHSFGTIIDDYNEQKERIGT